MADQFVIASGVTLNTLNPQNYSLKNDYLENLLVTAFTAFPAAAKVIGDRRFIVRKGFIPYSVLQENDPRASSDQIKHTKGLAVRFAWDGWTPEEGMWVAQAIYQERAEPVKVIVDQQKNEIYFSRGVNASILLERQLSGKFHIIRKE